jgi:hypothetical protein
MVESIFQTLLLLAYFDVALLSIAIANYAISASYLGRESRLSRSRIERRKEKLLGKLKELRETTQIESVKKEIKEAEAEQRGLGIRIFLLSWLGAVILPSMFLIISFICAVIGINTEILSQDSEVQRFLEQQFIIVSSGTLAVGFMILLFVIKTIDSSARQIPIPEIEVMFENRERATKLKRNEKVSIGLRAENNGEDLAEDLELYVSFPPAFKIGRGPYPVYTHDASHRYSNYSYVIFREKILHVGTWVVDYIMITMPDEKKIYEVCIDIKERKIGTLKQKLDIEIVD